MKHRRPKHRTRQLLLTGVVIASATLALQTIARGVTPAPSGPSTVSPIKHVFIIMEENTSWSSVKGRSAYSYVNKTLLPNYAHTENYVTHNHPSLPNYVSLEAGDNLGMTTGSYLPSDHSLATTSHLTTQLNDAGISWKYYAENLPGGGTTCNTSDPGTPYSQDHNPFTYFDDVKNNAPYCIAHERPFSELLASPSTIPQYSFIVPNDYNQGEKSNSTCKACQADAFLKTTVPAIQATPAYADGGLILVLWDEAGISADPDITPSGLIAISPLAKRGYAGNAVYSHGSTLRSVQEIFGVGPLLGSAATATDLSDLFTVPLVDPGSVVPPVASFTATTTYGLAPLSVSLTDTSTGTPTSWVWDFGDGSPTETTQNPNHTFTTLGAHTVTLTASNAGGPSSTTSTITVNPVVTTAPVASFTGTPLIGTPPLTVSFTDTSTGVPTSWAWDFGDATGSTLQNPSHAFAAAGIYTVTLTASNASGPSTPVAATITVNPVVVSAPVASFTAATTTGSVPLAVAFADTSTGVPTSWVWDFGDGTSSTSQNPSHTFTAQGTYTVAMTASNSGGPSTPVTTTITVTPVVVTAPWSLRINTGGATLGGSWTGDLSPTSAYGNAFAAKTWTVSASSSITTTDPSIPAGTPASIFQSARYDGSAGANMTYTVPVPQTGQYVVRLYFAEYSFTAVGKRKFSVAVNGTNVLTNFDIFAAAGGNARGIARTFTVSATGSIVIGFTRGNENPVIQGIEVVEQ